MIILDFIIDPELVRKSPKTITDQTKREDVLTEFLLPIRFCVDDIELSRLSNGEYARPGLLDFAINGLTAVQDLQSKDRVVFDTFGDAGTYTFERKGDTVSIRSDIAPGKVASSSYQDLLAAFESFQKKVKTYLRKELPDLLDHPLKEWF